MDIKNVSAAGKHLSHKWALKNLQVVEIRFSEAPVSLYGLQVFALVCTGDWCRHNQNVLETFSEEA